MPKIERGWKIKIKQKGCACFRPDSDADDFAKLHKEGILKIVLSGGDADTNAVVAGAIWGTKFGIDQIPKEWKSGFLYASLLRNKVQDFSALYR